MHQGSPLFKILKNAHCRAASIVIPLLPKAAFTLSIKHNLDLPRTRYPLRPSTPFWPYDTHPFFPHAQAISILSDLLYSLTPFLFQLSYAPLHSLLFPIVTLQPNFSNTSSQEYSLTFSQHFSYPMPLLRTTPFVQLLLQIDASWPAFIPNTQLLSTLSALPTLYVPHSFCVPHPFHISCHLRLHGT